MSDSPPVSDQERSHPEKETNTYASAQSDVETGDTGILVHAAPLARTLKVRSIFLLRGTVAGHYLRDTGGKFSSGASNSP